LDFGGVESRVVIQAEGMRDLVGEIRVCTFWKPGAAADRLGASRIPVDVLGLDPSITSTRATLTLNRYLRQRRPDILHCCIGEGNWHGLLAGVMAGVPNRIAEEVGLTTRGPFSRRLFPQLYRLAHCVIGVSEATCRFLREEDGVPGGKVALVYNAADAAYFQPPLPRRRPIDAPFRVVTVGRLDPVKNQAMLIRAFASLRRQCPDCELVLIGEGPSRPSLEALIAELHVADGVRLIGFRNDIRAQLADADLFVLPSLSEGFGIALVEAMACEVPVLAAGVGGLVEVVQGLGSEYLVAPRDEAGWTDAMGRIRAMPRDERKQLGRRGRRLVKDRFSPHAYIANLCALYERLMQR
jgi:glycosyltransferase involved in cell wall biosynthesis